MQRLHRGDGRPPVVVSVAEHRGPVLDHVGHCSINTTIVSGDGENFFGVAQVPIGVAGPLSIDGEYAYGEFLVPLATTEGTLIASYSRGMRLLTESGGVRTAVVEDYMPTRFPRLGSAAMPSLHHDYGRWVDDHFDQIREEAESTSSVVELAYIDPYRVGPSASCGSISRPATPPGNTWPARRHFAASTWILENYPGGSSHSLERTSPPTKSIHGSTDAHPG